MSDEPTNLRLASETEEILRNSAPSCFAMPSDWRPAERIDQAVEFAEWVRGRLGPTGWWRIESPCPDDVPDGAPSDYEATVWTEEPERHFEIYSADTPARALTLAALAAWRAQCEPS